MEEKALQFCTERLTSWQSAKRREKAAKKLLAQTGFRERRSNWRTALSAEQETKRLHDAWKFFDFLSWLVANGSDAELSAFFACPWQFRQRYRETALIFTDQIPVWLKVDSGATLTSEDKLSALRSGTRMTRSRRAAAAKKMARRAGRQKDSDSSGEELPPEVSGAEAASYLSRGPGCGDALRFRITLIARQAVEGFWDPSRVPVGQPS